MEKTNQTQVLVVRIPFSEDLPSLASLRDYILGCLSLGVLAVDTEVKFEVMELPPLAGVEVRPIQGAPKVKEKLSEAEEKRAILQRLKDYRDKNGPGCLGKVSGRMGRGRLSADTLLGVLTGDTVLNIEDWRKIGRALDRLEDKGVAQNV